jgi:hypothetical protein
VAQPLVVVLDPSWVRARSRRNGLHALALAVPEETHGVLGEGRHAALVVENISDSGKVFPEPTLAGSVDDRVHINVRSPTDRSVKFSTQ